MRRPFVSSVAGRSPATESDVCPPQRCDAHPNRTPGICARLPIARHRAHTAPAMPLTSAMAASFVVYPPPSHILRQDILRARIRDPPPRERTDRRTGTTRPSLARAGRHVSKNPVALFGNRIGPGFPRPLSRHTKQTIPTYRTRGPRREATPTPLPGRKQLVCSSIPSKSRYAPAELIRKRVPQRTGNGRARDGD